jgi:hypothetical protein
LISFLEIGGEMCRRQLTIGLTDHLAHSHESIVHEESAVHPDIPALAVFHPRLNIRHDLQELPERETIKGLRRLSHGASMRQCGSNKVTSLSDPNPLTRIG